MGESQKKVVSSKVVRWWIRARFVTDNVQGSFEKETRGSARENNEAQEVLEILTQFLLQVEFNELGYFVCGICYFLNIKNIPKSVFKPEFTGKRLEIWHLGIWHFQSSCDWYIKLKNGHDNVVQITLEYYTTNFRALGPSI